MTREVIGHMDCPECGSEAEVKRTKAGLAYRWCTECNAQYFPRTAEASDRLIAKCEGAKPEPVPQQEAKTPPAPAKPIKRLIVHPPQEVNLKPPEPAKPRSAFDDALAFLGGKA